MDREHAVSSWNRLTVWRGGIVEDEAMEKSVIRYSEAFKLHVVSELESGRLANQKEAREKYGIKGCSTIAGWLRRYGKNHLLGRVIRVEKPEERDQIKALKARIAALERALVDSKVQETVHKAYFEIVCEQTGVSDPEALKKSIDEKLLREASRRAAGREG